MTRELPSSLAIAGAWGYIGRKFLDAARQLGMAVLVYDPGPVPDDLDLRNITRITDQAEFYGVKADLFHLALHPENRRFGLRSLLARGRREPVHVLCEKPMAAPEHPNECGELLDAANRSQLVLLFDFPELFDKPTSRIVDFFSRYHSVEIDSIDMQRSKDREDPTIPRNYKPMVPIQYQESVHCLAFVTYLLSRINGQGLPGVFASGISFQAESSPYSPPNPAAYPYVVDGKCDYVLTVGPTTITGRTDFTRGAEWTKRRTLRGRVDGREFVVEADYLEGHKVLSIDGRPQDDVTGTNSYAEVISTIGRWIQDVPRQMLMNDLYPNPAFAQITYQLSSALWRSCHTGQTIHLASLADLLQFNASYAAASVDFPKYPGT